MKRDILWMTKVCHRQDGAISWKANQEYIVSMFGTTSSQVHVHVVYWHVLLPISPPSFLSVVSVVPDVKLFGRSIVLCQSE